jgi:RHS repeat-associated protein
VGGLPLQFVRSSNTRRVSQNSVKSPFGKEAVWTHNFQYSMRDAGIATEVVVENNGYRREFFYRQIMLSFPDGSQYVFKNSVNTDQEQQQGGSSSPYNSVWVSSIGIKAVLTQQGLSYSLLQDDGSKLVFLASGVTGYDRPVIGHDGSGGSGISAVRRDDTPVYYQLKFIYDSAMNQYQLEYAAEPGTAGVLSKITDASGRFLQLTYSDLQIQSNGGNQVYAAVAKNQLVKNGWNEVVIPLAEAKPAQRLMLQVKNGDASLSPLKVAELEFYDEYDVLISGTAFSTAPRIVALESPGSGGSSSASNFSYTPENAAFDGTTNSYCQLASSTTGHVGIELETPKRVTRVRYFVTATNNADVGAFEIVGNRNAEGDSQKVLTQVTSSDGRSVNYTYSTFNDPSGWFSWNVLSSVSYLDGTLATYSYAQQAPFSRPLMTYCRDPRIVGSGTEIEYTYNTEGALGFLKDERSGVTGDFIAGTGYDSSHEPNAIYPNGKVVKYEYSTTTAQIETKKDGLGRTTIYTHDAMGFMASVTDPLGRVTSFTNNVYGQPLTITYPDGTVKTQTYDTSGRLLSSSLSGANFTTRLTTYTRDNSGRVTQVTHPDGTAESWTYNAFGKPLTHTQQNGGVEQFQYSSSGLLLSSSDALGAVTSYSYNAQDLISAITDPLGHTTSFLYNSRGKVTRQTYADGTFTEYDYDDFDNLIDQVNELGQIWTTTYDEFRNPRIKTDPLGRNTTFVYGENTAGSCGSCRASGKPIGMISPSGRQVSYTYDLEWQLISETDGYGTADAATTQYSYDAAGNATQITDASGSTTTRMFDVRDRLVQSTDALNRTYTTAYDRASNVIAETRPDNGVTTHNYNIMDRCTSSTDAKGQTTTFGYDVSGNRVLLKDARNKSYTWGFDLVGLPTIMTYPDGSHENWTYDAAHQRLTARARNAAVATSTFDLRGRELTVNWNDSTPDIVRTFDDAGHLLSSSNGLSTSSYTYDIAGQQLTETQHLHGIAPTLPAYTVSYTWDADGRNATLTYPGGTVVSRTYTGRGQIETISEGAPPPLASYTYNLVGSRASKTLENGIVTTYNYDAAHQVTALGHFLGNTPLQTRGYLYNSVGNRTAMQVDGSAWDVYGFDAVDQITSAKYQSASSSGVTPQRTVAYDWDAVGNRKTVQTTPASGGATTDVYATANAVNQYPAINGSTVTHDANGNLTAARLQSASTGPVSTLGYDSSNRLLSVQNGSASVTSTYDTRNRVTSRTINGVTTLFLWDDWDLIEERNLSGTQTRRYVHGASVDEILIMVDATGAKYHHHDALGSVTALTNSSGAIIESYKYDVFGTATVYDSSLTLQPSSLIGNRFLYTGREWIAEAGIYDYRNRVFSPVIGRFLQTDPILFDAGDVNVYRYVGNNSMIWRDPSGKYAGAIGMGELLGGAFAGAAAGAVAGSVIPGIGTGAGMVVGALAGLFLFPATADAPDVPAVPSAPVTDIPGSTPPYRGSPGTTVRGGTQTREYGDDGYPLRDRDSPHPDEGYPGNDDHVHDWTRPEGGGPPNGPPGKPNPYRGPPREPQLGDPPCPRGPNVPPPLA